MSKFYIIEKEPCPDHQAIGGGYPCVICGTFTGMCETSVNADKWLLDRLKKLEWHEYVPHDLGPRKRTSSLGLGSNSKFVDSDE